MSDRDDVPPHDLEAEIAVLGSMLLDPTAARAAAAILTGADFYRSQHETAFRVLDRLAQDEQAIDPVLFRNELLKADALEAVGGSGFISRIVAAVPSAANAEHYARIVKGCAERRRAVEKLAAAETAERTGTDEDRAAAYSDLDRVRQERTAAAACSRFRSEVETGANLVFDDPPPEPDWLIGDALSYRGGTSALCGPFKSMKTTALVGLALDLVAVHERPEHAQFARFLGSRILKGGPVLILSAEGGRFTMRAKLDRAASALSRDVLRHLRIWSEGRRPNLRSDRDLRDVYRYAREEGCAAVLWDPFGRFWHPDPSVDLADDTNVLMDRLEQASIEANSATWFSNHDTKSGGTTDTGVTGGRGSGKIADDVSCAIVNLKATDAQRSAWQAHFVVRHGPPIPPRRIELDEDTLRIHAADDAGPTTARGGRGARYGLAEWHGVVRDDGTPIDESTVATAFGCSSRTVQDSFALAAAIDPRLVRRPGGGAGRRTTYSRAPDETHVGRVGAESPRDPSRAGR